MQPLRNELVRPHVLQAERFALECRAWVRPTNATNRKPTKRKETKRKKQPKTTNTHWNCKYDRNTSAASSRCSAILGVLFKVLKRGVVVVTLKPDTDGMRLVWGNENTKNTSTESVPTTILCFACVRLCASMCLCVVARPVLVERHAIMERIADGASVATALGVVGYYLCCCGTAPHSTLNHGSAEKRSRTLLAGDKRGTTRTTATMLCDTQQSRFHAEFAWVHANQKYRLQALSRTEHTDKNVFAVRDKRVCKPG